MAHRSIFCCQCQKDVRARLTTGAEIYPRRTDLARFAFWRCDFCGNYVGCHHGKRSRFQPLGNIPTPQLREARKHIHAILDPLWKSKVISRSELYREISDKLGHQYHTAELATLEDAMTVWTIVRQIEGRLEETSVDSEDSEA